MGTFQMRFEEHSYKRDEERCRLDVFWQSQGILAGSSMSYPKPLLTRHKNAGI
jgi:hypothetical protein